MLWIGITGELSAAVGGAINLTLTMAGLAIYLFRTYAEQQGSFRLVAGSVCIAGAMINLCIL
ncbi:MAG TPA: hypothetical protein VHB98_16015, partial [Chloroflexota bacterium]|nr:hypothetical protein [Chloroflexota bacterium]